MAWLFAFYRSQLGKKAIMAVTGFMLFGFVLGHMIGNLKLYQGAEKLNDYAEFLRNLGAPVFGPYEALWIARIGLLAAVGLHILMAYQLTQLNRRARPQAYAKKVPQKSTYASRTMRWGGIIIVLFIVYHLLHFTTGTVHSDFIKYDVYHNVVTGFQNPLISAFYIVANLALGFHLYHGLWSMVHSLGLSGPRVDPLREKAAVAFAVIITAANISFPVSVLTGIVTLSG
ncbi:MAG: succinate dehydrogenase cytochrome b subunit [Acidobacteriota bacterium]